MLAVERESVLSLARDALCASLPDAWAFYVHGSFARGDEWPSSDLDLAVLLPPGQRIPDKLGLRAIISGQVGREVDIVDLREASLDLIKDLLLDGRPLFIRRKADTLGWEAERMTDYADFNPRRAGILARYMREPLRARK
jgi:predicted nucleotidyltransferase